MEKLIAAGSAGAVARLDSMDELRLLASFLWLPRDSSPLRRLGLRIQSPGAGMAARTVLHGPGFEVELDNYRFSATTAARQRDADVQRAAADAAARLSAIASGEIDALPKRPLVAAAPSGTTPKVLEQSPSTVPLEDDGDQEGSQVTRPLPTFSLGTSYATHPLPENHPMHPAAQQPERPPAQPPRPPNAPDQEKPRGRSWPFSGILGRRNPE